MRICDAPYELVGHTVILKVNPDTIIKNKLEGYATITIKGTLDRIIYYTLYVLYKLVIAITEIWTTEDILLTIFRCT